MQRPRAKQNSPNPFTGDTQVAAAQHRLCPRRSFFFFSLSPPRACLVKVRFPTTTHDVCRNRSSLCACAGETFTAIALTLHFHSRSVRIYVCMYVWTWPFALPPSDFCILLLRAGFFGLYGWRLHKRASCEGGGLFKFSMWANFVCDLCRFSCEARCGFRKANQR